jgi:hypothetical protein
MPRVRLSRGLHRRAGLTLQFHYIVGGVLEQTSSELYSIADAFFTFPLQRNLQFIKVANRLEIDNEQYKFSGGIGTAKPPAGREGCRS